MYPKFNNDSASKLEVLDSILIVRLYELILILAFIYKKTINPKPLKK